MGSQPLPIAELGRRINIIRKAAGNEADAAAALLRSTNITTSASPAERTALLSMLKPKRARPAGWWTPPQNTSPFGQIGGTNRTPSSLEYGGRTFNVSTRTLPTFTGLGNPPRVAYDFTRRLTPEDTTLEDLQNTFGGFPGLPTKDSFRELYKLPIGVQIRRLREMSKDRITALLKNQAQWNRYHRQGGGLESVPQIVPRRNNPARTISFFNPPDTPTLGRRTLLGR